jgi:hypothetical protein
MHDQHDDPLERELAQLSSYTGEPTTVWKDAIDTHRREQHRKLWVWVRRPAPAAAAAALAVLVASVALRPPTPPRVERRSVSTASSAALSPRAVRDDGSMNMLSDFSGTIPLGNDGTVGRGLNTINDLARNGNTFDNGNNSGGADNFSGNTRVSDTQNEHFVRGLGSPATGSRGENKSDNNNDTRNGAPPLADNKNIDEIKPGEADKNAAYRGGVNTNTALGGSGGGGGPGNRPPANDPARVAGNDRADNHPATGTPLPPAAVEPPAIPEFKSVGNEPLAAKREEAEKKAAPSTPSTPAAAPAAGVPDVAGNVDAFATLQTAELSANLRVTVPDVNKFYFQFVPTLVNAKGGETFYGTQLDGKAPVASGKDAEQGVNLTMLVYEQNLPSVIDQLRKSGNIQEEKLQLPSKEERLKQVEAQLAEKEVELKSAYVDKAKAAAPLEGKDARDAKGGKSATPPAAAIDEARKKAEDAITNLNRQRARIEKGVDYARLNIQAVPEQQQALGKNHVPPPPLAPAPAGARPALAAAPASAAPSAPAKVNGAPDAPNQAGRTIAGDKADGWADNDTAPTGPTEPAPARKEVPGPKAETDGSPAPSAAAPAPSKPAPHETGKITRAAKEGWSSLGDSTADVIRAAIGTMIYWLPIVAAAVALLVWRRRNNAAAMREPPPP